MTESYNANYTDDLTARFSHSLTLNSHSSSPSQPTLVKNVPSPTLQHSKTDNGPTYASQHYTSSYYYSNSLPVTIIGLHPTQILAQSGINPHHLFPCQLSLFSTLDPNRRQKLIGIWTTIPPTEESKRAVIAKYGYMNETSMINEEIMARLRLEGQLIQDGSEGEMKRGVGMIDTGGDVKNVDITQSIFERDYPEINEADSQVRDFERLQAIHQKMTQQYDKGVNDDMIMTD